MLLLTGIIACLLFLFYQDLRYRAVYWVVFPVLLALLVGFAYKHVLIASFITNTMINLSFLSIQLILLSLYFSLKNKRWINITREYLGWGDVLFLLTVAFYLSPLNYLFFYIFSLIIVLLVAVFSIKKDSTDPYKIPLAGLQAFLFAVFLFTDWQSTSLNLQSDDWLIRYVSL